MSDFVRISIEQAYEIICAQEPVLVDVRDEHTHQTACIKGAIHLNNDNIQELLDNTPRDTIIIVYCYHGNSSLNAAQFLVQQGFENVMSLNGGFEAWRQNYPGE